MPHTIHTITDPDGDVLSVYPPNAADPMPSIQIDSADAQSLMVNYTPVEAADLARAILRAAGLDAKVTVKGILP